MLSPEEKQAIGVIAGPTASGKTGLAVALARRLGAELVGADSVQVFRGFDIGTAKPSAEELGGVPHHLIDVADPDEPYDAARYIREADASIAEIRDRGHVPLVVGGTGLYLRALLHGLHEAPPGDTRVRAEIREEATQKGWPALHARLEAVDPVTAARLHPNDGVRIGRALEVYRVSNVPMSKWQNEHGFENWRYDTVFLGIARPREELCRIIDARVDAMMASGFLGEVEGLLQAGCSPACKPMQALGYKRLVEHLSGQLPLEAAVEKIKTDTRRFAKRQMTWFRKEEGISWIPPHFDEMARRLEVLWKKR